MKLWIARDKDGGLSLFTVKPAKLEERGVFWYVDGSFMWVEKHLFPEVTWENSPQLVELKLVNNYESVDS